LWSEECCFSVRTPHLHFFNPAKENFRYRALAPVIFRCRAIPCLSASPSRIEVWRRQLFSAMSARRRRSGLFVIPPWGPLVSKCLQR
jgi:hypothetical protein